MTPENKKKGSAAAIDEIIKEIYDLMHIPEIKEFFLEAVSVAKQEFQAQIQQYQQPKDNENSEEDDSQIKKEKIADILNDLEQNKTFFFDFSRVRDPESESEGTWKPEKFKFKENEEIVNAIFSQFLEKLDQYEIAPNRIQNEIVYSSPLNRFLRISFTKTSESRVVGFVKKIEKSD